MSYRVKTWTSQKINPAEATKFFAPEEQNVYSHA